MEEGHPLVTGSMVNCVDRLWIVLELSRGGAHTGKEAGFEIETVESPV